jgi:hypothetical protein
MAAALQIALVLFFALSANAVTLGDYITTLQRIRNEPHDAAVADARALTGTTIDMPSGPFIADASLLDAIVRNDTDAMPRLDATLAALRTAQPTSTVQKNDARLIEQLRKQEEVNDLHRGGEVTTVPASNESFLEVVAQNLQKAWDWLADKFERFYDWIRKLWPHAAGADDEYAAFGGMPFVVTAVVIVIVAVLVILTLEVLRRSRPRQAEPAAKSTPIASKRDEDPLSRGANEWERYAVQLAAAGRVREAIRAWYHAVLVTCYGAGILHFRKGRTNWEYISAIRSDSDWRAQFVDLTRHFEREWYGRDESTPEALDDCSSRARTILDQIRRRAA